MTMAEKMTGKWKFLSSDNFEEYLKGVGLSYPIRKMANLTKPDLFIEMEGDKFCSKSVSTFKTMVVSCTIGEEFQETMPNQVATKSKMYWEDEKLHHVQTWDGKESHCMRYVNEDGHFVLEIELVGGAKCVRKFQRYENDQ